MRKYIADRAFQRAEFRTQGREMNGIRHEAVGATSSRDEIEQHVADDSKLWVSPSTQSLN